MPLALLAEGLGPVVDAAEAPQRLLRHHALPDEPIGERSRVGALARTEAAVATAIVARTEGAAAGVRHRAEARLAAGHGHADVPAALAFHADALVADARPPAREHRGDQLEELILGDGAAAQLEVDGHVGRD